MKLWVKVWIVAVLITFCFTPWLGAVTVIVDGPEGMLIDLGLGRVYGINNAGEVCGVSESGWPCRWKGWDLDAVGEPLGALPTASGTNAMATGINDQGVIVGWQEGTDEQEHAYVWEAGTITDTVTDYAGQSYRAYTLSEGHDDDCDMVGIGYSENSMCGAIWESGQTPTVLTGLGGTHTAAYGINRQGAMVGWSLTGGDPDQMRAVCWDTAGAAAEELLIPETYDAGEAYAINNYGVSVGRYGTGDGIISTKGFGFVDCFPVRWEGPNYYVLPINEGEGGCAYAVNEAKEIAGCVEGENGLAGYRWDLDGILWDFNDILVGVTGWSVDCMRAVNSLGMMAGWGTHDSQDHAILWIPKKCSRLVMHHPLESSPKVWDGRYAAEEVTPGGEELHYPSGLRLADGTEIAYEAQIINPYDSDFKEYVVYAVRRIKEIEKISQAEQAIATAEYDDSGRITRVEQINCDRGEPNDVITFAYDPQNRLTQVTRSIGEQEKEKQIITYASGSTHGRPDRIIYDSAAGDSNDVEASAQYDDEGRLIGIILWRREHDHIGNYICSYNDEGRIATLMYGVDDDCDGICETPVTAAVMYYDDQGRLTRVYDGIMGQDLVDWQREVMSPTVTVETIALRSTLGDPNVDTVTITVTEDVDKYQYGCSVNGQTYVEMKKPKKKELPIQISQWNWWGDDSPPPLDYAPRSAEKIFATRYYRDYDADSLSDRTLLPLINDSGLLAGTSSNEEMSICLHANKTRKAGLVAKKQEEKLSTEVHLYATKKEAEEKIMLAMLTLTQDGQIIIGIASGAKKEEDLARYNFFEAWPSGTRGGGTAALGDGTAYEENWPVLIPVYSQQADGSRYLAGTVTPDGIYSHVLYDATGQIRAMTRMNSVLTAECASKPEGDVNNDCMVNLLDLADMAANWLTCGLVPAEACHP